MKAVVRYSDKTVEQVQAEIKQREAAATSARKRGGKAQTGGEITEGHMNALQQLQAAAEKAKAEAQQG